MKEEHSHTSYLFIRGKMYRNNTSNISWPLFVENETGVKSKIRYLYAGETFVALDCYHTDDSYDVVKLLTEQSETMMMLVHPDDYDLFVEL
jgi:hypothetical protein